MNLVRFQNPHYNANKALVDQLFGNFFNNDYHENYVKNCESNLAANVFETEDDFKLELLLSGFKKEDVQIIQKEGLLTIKVDNVEEQKNENYKYAHREFGAYNFEKQYRLPKSVDTEKISAHFENGILNLMLPKKEEAKPKDPVEIKIS